MRKARGAFLVHKHRGFRAIPNKIFLVRVQAGFFGTSPMGACVKAISKKDTLDNHGEAEEFLLVP